MTGLPTGAQSLLPDKGYVFNDTIIPRIDIIIDPVYLDQIFSDTESFDEYPATFIFSTPAESDTIANIGFRLRGNTSRNSQKKSYKVSFNTFEPGRKFHGLEKMNINGEHNDPSIMRAKICWDMMRFMEVPAPRANHVRMYINGDYFGLYLSVEHIDEEFVRSRFGDLHGNLYKCLWPADLVYIDNNSESYQFDEGGRRAYDLKTNVEYEDYDDLAHFISVLNNSAQNEFACEINKVFNVPVFLKILAVDVLTGNWDNYSFLKNNFYLYLNPSSGRIEFIPYDMDNTFGVDWFDIDWANRDIYNWSNDESRPLYEKIMANAGYRDQYSYYLDYLLENYYSYDKRYPYIIRIQEMIRPYVVDDPYYPLDYGYTIDDFDRSVNQTIGAHVKTGIIPFINQRALSAEGQLVVNNIEPVVHYLDWNQPEVGDTLCIRALVEDNDLKEVNLMFAIFDGPSEQMDMYDDGSHGDGAAGDGIYGIQLVQDGFWDAMFYVSVTDDAGSTVDYPCDPVEIYVPISSQTLVINEFMASNNSSFADAAGEYDDWIEITNVGSAPQWLGNRFLSDDLSNRDKWKMPDRWHFHGEFIIIWADEDGGQGNRHANFKLSRAGEEIGIFDAPSTGFRVIDRVIYSEQSTNISLARSVDGGNQWLASVTPTPGASNHLTSDWLASETDQSVFVYPNPVLGDIVRFSQSSDVKVFDTQGRQLLEVRAQQEVNIESLIPGMYLLLFDSGEVIKLIRH